MNLKFTKHNSTQGSGILNAETNNFDPLFRRCWENLHKKDRVFRYKLNISKEKVLEGRYGFFLQLNSDRNTNRRSPVEIKSIKEEFDPDKFNFTKISPEEILFDIKNLDDEQTKHLLIINASPICFGHSLLCPFVDKCLPQIITYESLKLVTQLMLTSTDSNLRIGYNSLCGLASVNHLHYHLLIVEHRFLLETIQCKHISGNLFILKGNYPAPAFCFQVSTKSDIEPVSSDVVKLIEMFLKKNVGHNLFISKGTDFSGGNEESLRIFVWARRSSYGAKQLNAFNVAVCELSGHFPIFNKEAFDTLTEENIVNELINWTVDTFEDIYDDAVTLFQKEKQPL